MQAAPLHRLDQRLYVRDRALPAVVVRLGDADACLCSKPAVGELLLTLPIQVTEELLRRCAGIHVYLCVVPERPR